MRRGVTTSSRRSKRMDGSCSPPPSSPENPPYARPLSTGRRASRIFRLFLMRWNSAQGGMCSEVSPHQCLLYICLCLSVTGLPTYRPALYLLPCGNVLAFLLSYIHRVTSYTCEYGK